MHHRLTTNLICDNTIPALIRVGPVCLQINCQQYHLPTSYLPTVRLRTKFFAYSSIAYKLYFAQLKNSKTEVRLHTRHYCAQVALHT